MFEFVRNNNRLLQLLLLLLIVPSFVFFGVQGYESFTDGGNTSVAEVDGRRVTQQEWDLAHQRQVEQARRSRPDMDARLFDSPAAKRQTLDALVRERVLFSASEDANFAVHDERLVQELQRRPELAPLRSAQGTIDHAAYVAFLQAQGLSAQGYEASLRQELRLRQVMQPLSQSVLGATSTASAAIDALLQRREVQIAHFDAREHVAKVEPTDAELEAHYRANEARFRAPEQAQIEYVVLDLETLKKDIPVAEEELRKYYEQNLARYTVAEERRASHILVKADKSMPAPQREEAKKEAEQLLAQVRKAPASFAEVAKKASDDPGSAANGGDLGFFGRGAMVKPFEDAVFSMQPGEISNVVESDFGYHIIRLDAVRGGEKQSFESVRASIEDEVKKGLAQQRYAEAAEQFTNTVYEQADSLQPVIDKLKLTKQTATVQRTPAPGAKGPLASPKLLEAVFSNDTLTNKRNTDAVETGPNQLVSARVVQHTPARTLPLAEVKDRVRAQVVAEQAAALARKNGEELIAKLRAGEASATLPPAVTLSRNEPHEQPPQVIDAVLGASAQALPTVVGVALPDGYTVARVLKVLPPGLTPELRKQLDAAYARTWGAAESQAYYEALKGRYDVQIKAKAEEAAASAPSR